MTRRVPMPSIPHRSPPSAMTNRLLASLPSDDLARILPALDVLHLPVKHFLHTSGQAIEHVFFPGDGFCSMVTVLEDGGMVEVATVGREGMVGIFTLINGDPSPSATMVQAEIETCYRMAVRDFRREMDRRGPFFDLHTRYAQALVAVIMQSTACNAVHSVQQRLSRWLLMAHDHIGQSEFPLTQEFLAMMLGRSRPTLTVVAGALQKAGIIRYQRGQVTILDRRGLEEASCECYGTTSALLDEVTPPRSKSVRAL